MSKSALMLTREVIEGEDFAHASHALGRSKVAHILPSPAEIAPGRPIFVLLHPFGGNRTSWLKSAPDLMAKLAQEFIVVLPECGRNWFINDHSGKAYEDYLVGELIPLLRERCGAADRACIGGFSMGGASSFFLALRHPDAFAAAFAVAGAFTAGNRRGDPYEAFRTDALLLPTEAEHERVWGPPGSAVRASYEPGALVRQAKGKTRLPKFYFEVGRNDYPRALEASETMRALLADAGGAFEFAQCEGDHSWAYAADGMTRLIAQFQKGQERHG
jgi:putative tributyrin esterase